MTIPDGVNVRPQGDGNGTAEGSGTPRPGGHGLPSGITALPPSNTKRWVIRRKAAVVGAVRAGVLTLDEACQRYHLSVEEFLSWQQLIDKHGMRGLRATRLQDYRANRAAQSG